MRGRVVEMGTRTVHRWLPLVVVALVGCGLTDPGAELSENTISFTGSVLLDGEPYEGAEVEFFEIELFLPDFERRIIATTTSDSEGAYHISGSVRCRPGDQLALVWNLSATIVLETEPFELVLLNSGRLRCVEEVQVFDFE